MASTRNTLTSTESLVKRDLEALYLEIVCMAKHLTVCSISNVTVVPEFFENALQQVKHFHHPLILLDVSGAVLGQRPVPLPLFR